MVLGKESKFERVTSDEFHEIQVHILRQLGYRNQKKFSGLQGDWNSSKVSFHLNKLVDEGLVEKSNSKYQVTPEGKGILADIKLNKYRAPINLLNLVILSPNGNVYLKYCADNMDPLANSYRTMISHIVKGDRLEEKSKRMFEDIFGYKPNNVKKAGVLENVLRFKSGVSQHYILHTYYIESDEDNADFYSKEEMEDIDILPGLEQIITQVKNKEELPFMGEWGLEEKEGFEVEKLIFE